MGKVLIVTMVLAIPALASAGTVLFDSQGFESPLYNLGLLPGQDLWVSDSIEGQPDPQVINDPTGGGMGQVVEIDAVGNTGPGWSGAYRAARPSVPGIVVIEWDQYRVDTGDNLWYADHILWDGWWAMQWDVSVQASAQGFDFGVAIVPNKWQKVTYTFDTINQTVTVDVDGTSFMSPNAMIDPTIDGIDFEVEPTPTEGDGPVLVDNVRIMGFPIPEPSMFLLAGVGLLALLRRKK
jgi:hypothetical protein